MFAVPHIVWNYLRTHSLGIVAVVCAVGGVLGGFVFTGSPDNNATQAGLGVPDPLPDACTLMSGTVMYNVMDQPVHMTHALTQNRGQSVCTYTGGGNTVTVTMQYAGQTAFNAAYADAQRAGKAPSIVKDPSAHGLSATSAFQTAYGETTYATLFDRFYTLNGVSNPDQAHPYHVVVTIRSINTNALNPSIATWYVAMLTTP